MTNNVDDFDSLLDSPPTEEEKSAVASLKDEGVPVETPQEARIRELEETIARLSAAQAAAPAEPDPATKERQHREALAKTQTVLNSGESFETVSEDDDVITLHILDTGITFAGKVWNYGQNVQIKRGGEAYKGTVDRNGNSWLDDLSPEAQKARFKRIVVGEGLYSGPEFKDAIAAEDARRGTAAPVVRI